MMRSLLLILLLAVGTTNLAFAANSKNDKNPNYNVGKRVGAIMQKIAKDVKKGKLSKAQAIQLRGQVKSIVSAQPVNTLSPDQLKQVDAQLKQIYNSL
jgi:hypothetical protein